MMMSVLKSKLLRRRVAGCHLKPCKKCIISPMKSVLKSSVPMLRTLKSQSARWVMIRQWRSCHSKSVMSVIFSVSSLRKSLIHRLIRYVKLSSCRYRLVSVRRPMYSRLRLQMRIVLSYHRPYYQRAKCSRSKTLMILPSKLLVLI